ncbi:MAG: hypothetical protein H0X24_05365 [Ktedonobacterales bacterium]|nr:hypothetical protein [Ktedonobacterales bacterium]
MPSNHKRLVGRLCLAMILAAWGLVAQQQKVQAKQHAEDYSLTLTAKTPTTTQYGFKTSGFVVVFDHPTNNPINGYGVGLSIDNGPANHGPSDGGGVISPTELQITYDGFAGLSAGTHTIQAQYTIPGSSTVVSSNAVSITVSKGDVYVRCSILTVATTFLPGQSMTLGFEVSSKVSGAPVDWQQGTFIVTFNGPTTATHASLKANTNEQVTVNVPTTPGQYQVICSYGGSPNFNAADGSVLIADVGQGHATGPIRLYSNPSTVQPGQAATWYVVIPPGPGLPTPTGTFRISWGFKSTNPVHVSPAGDGTIPFTFTGDGYHVIEVFYAGDANYKPEYVDFTQTNPPIPSNSGGGGQPVPSAPAGGTGTATPGTPAPTPVVGTPMPTEPATATTPIASAEPGATKHTTTDSGTGTMPIVLGSLGLLVLAGGGGMLLWRRRTVPTSVSASEHASPQEPGELDDTVPLTRQTPPGDIA